MHNSSYQVPTAHPPCTSSLQFPYGKDCSSSLASPAAAIRPALGLESLPGRAPPILPGQNKRTFSPKQDPSVLRGLNVPEYFVLKATAPKTRIAPWGEPPC